MWWLTEPGSRFSRNKQNKTKKVFSGDFHPGVGDCEQRCDSDSDGEVGQATFETKHSLRGRPANLLGGDPLFGQHCHHCHNDDHYVKMTKAQVSSGGFEGGRNGAGRLETGNQEVILILVAAVVFIITMIAGGHWTGARRRQRAEAPDGPGSHGHPRRLLPHPWAHLFLVNNRYNALMGSPSSPFLRNMSFLAMIILQNCIYNVQGTCLRSNMFSE